MSNEWKLVRLGDCANVTLGQSPDSTTYNTENDGLPFYQGNADFGILYPQVRYYCNKPGKLAYPNNILMSVRAPVGALNIANNDCCIGRGLCAISEIDNLSFYKYLYYVLLYNQSIIQSLGVGSTFKAISGKIVSDISIPLPSLSRQKEIAGILDKASELIEKRKEQLRELDALSESVFQDMFGDPVTNEKGWEISSINNLSIELFAGGDAPKELSTIRDDVFCVPIYANAKKDLGLYGFCKTARVTAPSLTISARGSGTGFTVERTEPFCPIVRLIVVTPNRDLVSLKFMYYVLSFLGVSKTGCAIPQLTVPMIKNKQIPLPPLSLQQQFAAIIEKIEAQKAKVKEALKESEDLFERLMQDLFNPDQD